MNKINAKDLDHKALNESIREGGESLTVEGCCGQRFIAAGMSGKDITIKGVPGNALGAYLNGGTVSVLGNAQDAVGDTMNEGTIVIHGNIGDAAGYAMRGGRIYVQGNAGEDISVTDAADMKTYLPWRKFGLQAMAKERQWKYEHYISDEAS